MICYPADLYLTVTDLDIIALFSPEDQADLVVLDPEAVWFDGAEQGDDKVNTELTRAISRMPEGLLLRKVSLAWFSVRGTRLPDELENYYGSGHTYLFCFKNPDGDLSLLVQEDES